MSLLFLYTECPNDIPGLLHHVYCVLSYIYIKTKYNNDDTSEGMGLVQQIIYW